MGVRVPPGAPIYRKVDMYAIVNVVYGVPLHSVLGLDDSWSEELEELIESQEEGFLTPYSGSGDEMPAAFGVSIGEFDEACHHVELSKLRLKPTNTEDEEFTKLWERLEPVIQKEITDKFGEPRVFFLWSTS